MGKIDKKELDDLIKRCTIHPRGARVLVKIDEFKYTGLIEIPQDAQRKPTTGVVIAVGPAITDLNVGDRVVFGVFAGTLLKFENKPLYQLLGDEEIQATLESETEVEAFVS